MSFWQGLAYSYNAHAGTLKAKFPLSTTSISNKADIIAVITVSEKGDFIRADKIEKSGKDIPPVSVILPVTEQSLGRSSGICPHPIFDQYEYLKGAGEKFKSYISEFEKFANSEFATRQIKAIYNYVSKKTVSKDLKNIGAKDKTNIIFKVEVPGNPESKVWEDESFFSSWHNYYVAQKSETKALDYISGETQPIAISHPKKISNGSANSKLISDNDNTNYTFRGKFKNSSEALSIGYDSSQKAHQFLRYLVSDRGVFCGEQVILSYTIGKTKKLPSPLNDTKSVFDDLAQEYQTDSDKEIALRAQTGNDYAEALKKALAGYNSKSLQKHERTAVITLDAATTGRLSITFYRELDETDYLEKIANWHDSCKWHQTFWDKEKKPHQFIGSPSVDRIIEAVYGKPRGGSDESYNKIKKAARERLLCCIFDGERIPRDYVLSAIHRASNPLANESAFEQILSTTCALVRKFYKQQKEEYQMALDKNIKSRDYLYGRLLGAADKLEDYVNYKNDNDRTTNAIRYMSAFSQHPYKTWKIIYDRLNPYIQTFQGHSNVSLDEIEEISSLFDTSDYENDSPLNGTYLLSYFCERQEIDKLVTELKNKKQPNKGEQK
jgi:CRISPR-associated protein Csd1